MPFAELSDLDTLSPTQRETQHCLFQGIGRWPSMNTNLFMKAINERCHDAKCQRMASLVGIIHPGEIEALLHRIADIKARYIAAVLETGKTRGTPRPGQHDELRYLRTLLNEAEQGLDTLRDSIIQGELLVEGLDQTPS